MKITGKQIASARELLGLKQTELAAAAGVSNRTIHMFETNQSDPYPATIAKILAELERRGIEFTNGSGIGVRLDNAKAAEYARSVAQAQNETDR